MYNKDNENETISVNNNVNGAIPHVIGKGKCILTKEQPKYIVKKDFFALLTIVMHILLISIIIYLLFYSN